MNIVLEIDRLVLHGVPLESYEHGRLQAAIEAVLARLLAENGLPEQFRTHFAAPAINGGALALAAEQDTPTLGANIAHAVYASFGEADSGTASTGETM